LKIFRSFPSKQEKKTASRQPGGGESRRGGERNDNLRTARSRSVRCYFESEGPPARDQRGKGQNGQPAKKRKSRLNHHGVTIRGGGTTVLVAR